MAFATRVRVFFAIFLCLGVSIPAGSALASVDSVVLTIPPGDPCEAVVKRFPASRIKVPTAFEKIRGKFKDKISLDVQTYALVACNDVKDSIIEAVEEQIKSIDPYAAAEAEAQRRLSGYANELYAGFLAFVAETAREPLLAGLSEEQRAAFAPGSPEADALALQWLNSPDAEITAYLSAYLHSIGGSGGSSALGAVFDDYMSGASQEVIDGFGDLLDGAQKRLSRFLDAKTEVVEQGAPYMETMKKYGFSGEWIEKLEGSEKTLREIDSKYNVVAALDIAYTAISTDEPDQKIRGFFSLIEHFGSVAESSHLPMVSLVGQIIAAYGDVAVQMLDGLDSLETAIRTNEGYCVGLGTHAGRDPREAALAELLGQKAGQADIRICPLKPGRQPWADIFYAEQPNDLNQLYFYFGDKFVAGQAGGGGKEAVLAAIQLSGAAAENGFAAYEGKASDVSMIAFLYNLPFEDEAGKKGLLALTGEANTAISTISQQIDRIKGRLAPKDAQCPLDSVKAEIEKQTGLRMDVFPISADLDKLQVLKANYAIAFAEKHRTFSSNIPNSRQQAYGRYHDIWQRIRLLSLLQVEGRVADAEYDYTSCAQCAGASISVNITGGKQISGCEIRNADKKGRFFINLITNTPNLALTINANAGGVKADPYKIDMRYLENVGRSTELPFTQYLQVKVPVRFPDENVDTGQALQNAFSAAGQACDSYRTSVEQAQKLADQWQDQASKNAARQQQTRGQVDPQTALREMETNFDQAGLAMGMAEDDAGKTCAAAKDVEASWVSSEAERVALRDKANASLRQVEQSLAELQQARQTSRQILQNRPSAGSSQISELYDRNFGESAGQFLLSEPELREQLLMAEQDLQGLRPDLNSWLHREEDMAKPYVPIFAREVERVAACKAQWLPEADRVVGLLEDLEATSFAPPADPASSVWTQIEEMAAQIDSDANIAEGLLDQARECVGAVPGPAPVAGPDHSFIAQGWVGKQRLTEIHISGSSLGRFDCNNPDNCVAAVNRVMAQEAATDDEDFLGIGEAMAQAIKSILDFMFTGMHTGLLIEAAGPQTFALHTPDIGLGEASSMSVPVHLVEGNHYEGTSSQNVLEGSDSTLYVSMEVVGTNQIKLVVRLDAVTKDDRGSFGFVADLHPGTVDGAAIKAANEAEIARRMEALMPSGQ
jgi:hypothetical protein